MAAIGWVNCAHHLIWSFTHLTGQFPSHRAIPFLSQRTIKSSAFTLCAQWTHKKLLDLGNNWINWLHTLTVSENGMRMCIVSLLASSIQRLWVRNLWGQSIENIRAGQTQFHSSPCAWNKGPLTANEHSPWMPGPFRLLLFGWRFESKWATKPGL